MSEKKKEFRAGFVAVIGRPNVGKSTLINNLLKFPLAITTPKPQTTRHRILGIHSEDNLQIIFLDTPGLIDPRYRMQEVMLKAAKKAINDADVNLLLAPPAPPIKRDFQVLEMLSTVNTPVILALNKIDLVKEKKDVLPVIDAYRQAFPFADIVPISTLKNENIDELKKSLVTFMPFSPPFYPKDEITEHPERFFVSELIREQIFRQYGEEIPFSTAVVIDEFIEQTDRKDVIKARIVVEKQSQKKIIIGKKGNAIRTLGQNARKEIEKFLDRPVFLELWVAVRENWRKKDVFLKEFGLES